MSKFCPNCGNSIEENQTFCANCGAQTSTGAQANNTTVINNNYNTTNNVLVPERNIVMAIILTIVTCGIYGLIWFVKMTDEAKAVSKGKNASGVVALLFSLITSGIYSIYWNYKMGKNMYEAGKIHNKDIADNSVLYLILSLFGLGIVNWCLIQSDLNKFSK